jgi:hypothetical protein
MDRIRFIPLESDELEQPACWHCGRTLFGPLAARYMYRRRGRAIVEEWRICVCGAYQNSARLHDIEIERLSHP